MKTIIALIAAVLMSGSCLAAQSAAPAATPKGVQNAKKVLQLHKERYQRVKDVKKVAHARKQSQRKQLTGS